MYKRFIFILILLFILNSCESVTRGLTGQKRNTSDEFLVKKKDPLILPPSFKDLPNPENVDQIVENKNEIENILSIDKTNTKSQKETTTKNSSTEECILKRLKNINIETKPYPGFPTDLQAQIMVLMTSIYGISTIKENIFENRFMHVSELRRMGAGIEIKGNKAIIFGKKKLNGAELMATDLRASVCLVLAGLVASNKTIINRIYHLDRGYEKIEKKLSNCGAQIRRLRWMQMKKTILN